MLIKKTTVERIGLLPEEYFFGVEDVDYSIKTRRAGFKIVYIPRAKIWHKRARSVVKVGLTKIKYHFWSYQLVRRKYLSPPVFLLSTPYFVATSATRFFLRSLRSRSWQELKDSPRIARAVLKGIVEAQK